MYVCVFMYVCMYATNLHFFKNKQYFVHKYLCNVITELHNVTNWASSDSYCSCCTVLPSYSNVN